MVEPITQQGDFPFSFRGFERQQNGNTRERFACTQAHPLAFAVSDDLGVSQTLAAEFTLEGGLVALGESDSGFHLPFARHI